MRHKLSEESVSGSGIYEYAFIPVPKTQRKDNRTLFYILTGYTSALSCLVLGSKLGASMPFWQAVGACFLGDIVLILIGTCMGILSAQTGWSTAFLSQKVLGKATSIVFSLLIILCSIFWIGLNGSLFTSMLISVFPAWPLPVAVTTLIVIAAWALSAAIGWKGLAIACKIVVPCSLALLLYSMIRLAFQMGNTDFLFGDLTSPPVSFAAASTAVIGNFVFGCIITPDTCRFAKSSKSVMKVCPPAYFIGLFIFNICGVIIGKAGGFSDFIRSTASLGLIAPMMLCSIFCLSTTQNINIYGGSLAMQNIFQKTALEGNVSHKVTAYLIAGLAAALSILGVDQYLLPVVSSFSILMVPLPGMLLGEYFLFRNHKVLSGVHGRSIAIWAAGSLAGFFFLQAGLPIAPFWAMLFSGVCYAVVNKWLGRERSKVNIPHK